MKSKLLFISLCMISICSFTEVKINYSFCLSQPNSPRLARTAVSNQQYYIATALNLLATPDYHTHRNYEKLRLFQRILYKNNNSFASRVFMGLLSRNPTEENKSLLKNYHLCRQMVVAKKYKRNEIETNNDLRDSFARINRKIKFNYLTNQQSLSYLNTWLKNKLELIQKNR